MPTSCAQCGSHWFTLTRTFDGAIVPACADCP